MKLLIGLAAATSLAAAALFGANASDFGPAPANYEADAISYITSRLDDSRGARFDVDGAPYQVYADIAGYEDLPAWAVDVRVKARLPGGNYGGYLPYTVVFVDQEPVALDQDDIRLSRL